MEQKKLTSPNGKGQALVKLKRPGFNSVMQMQWGGTKTETEKIRDGKIRGKSERFSEGKGLSKPLYLNLCHR